MYGVDLLDGLSPFLEFLGYYVSRLDNLAAVRCLCVAATELRNDRDFSGRWGLFVVRGEVLGLEECVYAAAYSRSDHGAIVTSHNLKHQSNFAFTRTSLE